jgi:hypothetical protein
MNNKLKVGVEMSGSIEAQRILPVAFSVKTVWDFECFRKDGSLKWAELQRPNIITTEGLNSLLDVYLRNQTQIAAWYIAPVETDTDAALGMTYAVPVFTEWDGYTEAARQAYTGAAASGGVITNTASKATFTSNETKTLYGAALVGGGAAASTMSDTAGGGTLFCYSKFSSSKDVENTDTFKVTLTVTIANA